MFSYQTYKMLHYLGLILLFVGLGGVLITALAGQKLEGKPKLVAFVTHGLGMTFLLVAGFGMLARLQIGGIPPWIHAKLAVWLALGVAISLAKRMPSWITLAIIVVVGMLAPYFAIYKPF